MKKIIPIILLSVNIIYNIIAAIPIFGSISKPINYESPLASLTNSLNFYLSYHLIYLVISMLVCISLIVLLLGTSKWLLKLFWIYILIGFTIQISNIIFLKLEALTIIISIAIFGISSASIILYLLSDKEKERRRGYSS